MGIDFFAAYGGRRAEAYPVQPESVPLDGASDGAGGETVDLTYEVGTARWQPLTPRVPEGFRPIRWPERPRRFIDGKNVGDVIATLRSPEGFPIPVKLSQICAAVVEENDGALRRTEELVQRVVTLIGDPFPWNEIEGLAAALQGHDMRLLLARLPANEDGSPCFVFETLRSATLHRTFNELAALEESLLETDDAVPTVIDGGVKYRSGGKAILAPYIGVIKTHHRNYLSADAMQAMYLLQPGERTPAFLMENAHQALISFYLRLSAGAPGWGVVRVEMSQRFYEAARDRDPRYLDKLAYTLFEYRCRQQSYGRAAVSLHPIVRVEQLLGALLSPQSRLNHRFYRIAQL